MFGFLEGIWYLDILYQGHRPAPYTQEDSLCNVKIEIPIDLEEDIELNRIVDDNESCYRRDFFLMLEDVVLLGGGTEDLPKLPFNQ